MQKRYGMRWMTVAIAVVVLMIISIAGCGENGDVDDEEGDLPESCTVYQVIDFTNGAAEKWEKDSWAFQVRDGDMDGAPEGKAKIWEVYYFAPEREQDNQMLVIFNRGNIWPNTPGTVRGGEEGRDEYRENKPPDLRVDSPEAVFVADQNGGSEYMEQNPEAKVRVALRCEADYLAGGDRMPAPGYKWIYDIYYGKPELGSEELHVYVDGITGDYISKETK